MESGTPERKREKLKRRSMDFRRTSKDKDDVVDDNVLDRISKRLDNDGKTWKQSSINIYF